MFGSTPQEVPLGCAAEYLLLLRIFSGKEPRFVSLVFHRPPGLIKKNGKMYLKQKSMRQADKNHKFTPQENNTNFSAPIQAILQISLFSCCKGVQYKKMTQFSALVVIFLFFVA
ncbi:MAG: hypothetical protein BA867_01210 [Desulfobacterales bacterium S5133MH16]|nr:MAG: hypothetical protein BA867_01210 [Desulfobacterales bacterium S5133MH16]